MNEGALLFGSIGMGMIGGIFGSLFVTAYFRWLDKIQPHPTAIFVASAIIVFALLVFVVYAFYKLKEHDPKTISPLLTLTLGPISRLQALTGLVETQSPR